MESYKDFALIYDDLIYGDIDYKLWHDKILLICKEYDLEFKNYLDVACGTGNMTELMAANFKQTWAVDLSEEMLMEAQEKLRAKKIKANFICQDMTKLSLNKKFQLITCCLDSINYIIADENLNDFFKAVYDHLEDKGLFIFDINSYYKLTQIIGNNTFTYCEDEIAYIWENYMEEDIVNMSLSFFVKDKNYYNRFDEEHIERAYTEDKMDRIIKNSGFNIIAKLDNYSSDTIKQDTERITYIISK